MRTIENVDILVWSFPVLGTNTFVSRIVLICYPARVFLFTKIEWKWCTRLTRTLAAHPNQFNWISSAIWVQMPKKPTWTALTMKCKVSTWYIRFLKSVFFFLVREIYLSRESVRRKRGTKCATKSPPSLSFSLYLSVSLDRHALFLFYEIKRRAFSNNYYLGTMYAV